VRESSNPLIETTFFTVARDGWQLAVHHYQPLHQTVLDPVLLVHGLGANRYNLDAPGRYSVARYLARSGASCFVAELRGAGASVPAHGGRHLDRQWTFDDYVFEDLPSIVSTILERTKRTQLHWLGHSMGGMLGYAFAGGENGASIRSLIAIGSPCFTQNDSAIFDLALYLRPIAKRLKTLPYEGLGHLLLPVLPLFRDTAGRLLANPRNMDFNGLQGVLRKAPSSLPVSLMLQFATWHESGSAVLSDGRRLTELLTNVQAPTMLVIGSDDRLASVADQESIFKMLPCIQKELLVLSTENGVAHDYGHVDPSLGFRAESEVWPHLLRWVRAQDPKR
jgi:pimeloyl-ACP methyl ester carboxylesterase